MDVAGDGEAGVIGRVVLAEEFAHVVDARRLDVVVRADDVGVVGMIFREELMVEFLLNQSVGRVLDRLTALVANHVPLIREPLAVQLPQQVAHAVAFEPER